MIPTPVNPSLLRAIRVVSKELREGTFISVDPSSGSKESSPAFAIFKQGKLVSADSIRLPPKLLGDINQIPYRLRYISQVFRDLGEFDLMVIECFHYRPDSKTDHKAVQQLYQAVGCISSSVQWKQILQVLGFEWAKHRPKFYKKSDIADAVYIGNWAISLAEAETNPVPPEAPKL